MASCDNDKYEQVSFLPFKQFLPRGKLSSHLIFLRLQLAQPNLEFVCLFLLLVGVVEDDFVMVKHNQ